MAAYGTALVKCPPNGPVTLMLTGEGGPKFGNFALMFCLGPDNNFWACFDFSGEVSNAISRISREGIVLEVIPVANPPLAICAGPDGASVWIVDWEGVVSQYVIATGEFNYYGIPGCGPPDDPDNPLNYTMQDLCVGPDGNIWFVATQTQPFNAMAMVGTVITDPPSAPNWIIPGQPYGINAGSICTGPGGTLWVGASGWGEGVYEYGYLVELTTGGLQTAWPLGIAYYAQGSQGGNFVLQVCPGPPSLPDSIWYSLDSNIDYQVTDYFGPLSIGNLNLVPPVTINNYAIDVGSENPWQAICAGPDDNMWLVVDGFSQIDPANGGELGYYTLNTLDPRVYTYDYMAVCGGPDGNLWAICLIYEAEPSALFPLPPLRMTQSSHPWLSTRMNQFGGNAAQPGSQRQYGASTHF